MHGEMRTIEAQVAGQLYQEVKLCQEMGWTREELYAQEEEFVWACLQVLSLESEKMRREADGARARRPL